MHEIETGLQHAKLDAYATGTCGQDPPFFFFFFYKHRLFFHINNILQLSMYHCMTYIQ